MGLLKRLFSKDRYYLDEMKRLLAIREYMKTNLYLSEQTKDKKAVKQLRNEITYLDVNIERLKKKIEERIALLREEFNEKKDVSKDRALRILIKIKKYEKTLNSI